jgi:hypothetical protein
MRPLFCCRFLRGFWPIVAFIAVWLTGFSVLDARSAEAAAAARATSERTRPKSEDQEKYLRLRCDEQNRPVALDVAIVRFEAAHRGEHASVVDLVGAVHIAEPAFFAELNRRFVRYDAVLYELVAPEGTRPPRGKTSGGSPLTTMQTGLTRLLGLQFQLEGIDYGGPNMVHADMSPDEFRQSMSNRGESIGAMLFRTFAYSVAKQSTQDAAGPSDMEMLAALLDKNRSLAMKRTMAKQFQDMNGVLQVIDGPDGSTLISRRNAKALNVLRREMNAGKRRIAIFYGAGHLPDMSRRLVADFGMRPTNTEWLRAWDMSEPKAKTGKTPPAKTQGRRELRSSLTVQK